MNILVTSINGPQHLIAHDNSDCGYALKYHGKYSVTPEADEGEVPSNSGHGDTVQGAIDDFMECAA